MAFLDESIWRGKVFSRGWRQPSAATPRSPSRPPARNSAGTGIASPADIAAAAAAAAAAQPAWAATPHTERAAILRRAGDIWKANAEEIEQLEHPRGRQDRPGGPVRDARGHRGGLRGRHAALAPLRRAAAHRVAPPQLGRAGPGRAWSA